jgi:hypothetical protein
MTSEQNGKPIFVLYVFLVQQIHYPIIVVVVVLPSSTYLFTAGVEVFSFTLDHTETHTTVGKAPLDEGSARRRYLYLTTQTLYKRQTPMHPVGFEPPIPASARPQIYALDRTATPLSHYHCSFISQKTPLRDISCISSV